MAVANPVRETVDVLLEEGSKALESCYQCGLCTGICPWNLVRSFTVRGLIHQAQLVVVGFEDEDVWLCATCGACVAQCPRGVEIIDIVRAVRRTILELDAGSVPDSLRIAIKSISGTASPSRTYRI